MFLIKLSVMQSREAPVSESAQSNASALFLFFLNRTRRFIMGVGHLLNSAELHDGFETDVLPFFNRFTTFTLDLRFFLKVLCLACTKQ